MTLDGVVRHEVIIEYTKKANRVAYHIFGSNHSRGRQTSEKNYDEKNNSTKLLRVQI